MSNTINVGDSFLSASESSASFAMNISVKLI